MAITLNEAKALEYRQVIYHARHTDGKGRPVKWRVAGAPRTWKTMPERVLVPLRYGLDKTTFHMTENWLDDFCLHEWEATGEKITFRKDNDVSSGLIRSIVILGKTKVPYKNQYVDREIGEVWKSTEGKWYHGQSKHWFKSRIEAATDLCNTMLD